MGAQVQMTRSFGALDHLDLLTAEDMRDVGLLVREQIVRRTLRGLDVNGAAFQPYSPGYAKAKRDALGTAAVNLQVSGGMINDLTIVDVQVEEERATVTLGWTK